MNKVQSFDEFTGLRNKVIKNIDPNKKVISISAGTCGQARGSNKLIEAFQKALVGNENKITLKITGCHGFCAAEPNVIIYPQGIFYQNLKPEDAAKIIDGVLQNKIIEDFLFRINGDKFPEMKDIPFYKHQMLTVLLANSFIDPTSIDDYLSVSGYSSIESALKATPVEIIEKIKRSGLRGRGGAGFPTGKKWENTRNQKSEIKYIICNADEGDPGAYMDRSLLEGNPHSVIEGMIIGAYAIGANEGWIYVRNEYPLAVKNVTNAINQARSLGLLGKNILGSGFDFDIRIVKGAGAFVCGEETALIHSIESMRGVPRQRPPFPSEKGLFGKPTNINNVETWANVTKIIEKGEDWFSSVGTKTSKGTKIFSIVGKVKNTGLIEVPMGITLRNVIYDIGGGGLDGKKIKAVQTGGPSGGCIPSNLFNLPVDYESLSEAGSIMGSGGMIVMDEDTCMVDVAKYFTNFLQDESCGKCVPCREGTQRMYEILKDITEGKGTQEQLETLVQLGNVIKSTSMCGLGQTAANPVLGTIRYFTDEYTDHIKKKKCSAAVCKEIVSSLCQHTCPIDTEASTYIALIAHGRFDEALEVIKKDNPLASVLARVCNHPCESKCRASETDEPITIRNLKRFVTDYGLKNNLKRKVEPVPKNKLGKIAIIGSGPAGLTCSFYLAQNGYEVTVFEKQPVIGGMLAVGVPEFRLPREILKTDIEYIQSAGVDFKTNQSLGKDFTTDDLFRNGYNAVFIATGAHKSLKLNIPGEDTDGVFYGMDVLTSLNLGKEFKIGKYIGIIGGGNSAIDAARTILRTGKADTVTIFYRRTIAEMPAFEEEVIASLEEGIKIEYLTAPKKIISENSKIKACEFIRMKLGDMDESGRRTPVEIKGSEFIENLDTLVISISEQPDISFISSESNLVVTKKGTLNVDSETLATNVPGIFAGGDIVSGPNTVVDAVAAGKIAADSIDKYLRGEEMKREYKITRPSRYVVPIEFSDKELEELLTAKRAVMNYLPPEERKHNMKEVEMGLTEEQAVKEAKRCLRCDLETEDGSLFIKKTKQNTLVRETQNA